MKFKFVPVMFLVLGLVISGSMSAYPMGRPMGQGGDKKFVERLTKDLGLTKDQKDKLVAQFKKVDEEVKPIMDRNRDLMQKMEQEIQKDSPSISQLSGYLEKIGGNSIQIQIKRITAVVEFKKDLTPEQKDKFNKIMKKHGLRDGKREKLEK
jgi:Spy/CpxP family protein refolding chaperone